MQMIELTHANTNQVALIVVSKIFGYSFSDAHKAVIVYSDAGAVFPVKESMQEISDMLKPLRTNELGNNNMGVLSDATLAG